jgi:hypothetical protein
MSASLTSCALSDRDVTDEEEREGIEIIFFFLVVITERLREDDSNSSQR